MDENMLLLSFLHYSMATATMKTIDGTDTQLQCWSKYVCPGKNIKKRFFSSTNAILGIFIQNWLNAS